MTHPRLTWDSPTPDDGTLFARLGNVYVGAVYPPDKPGRDPWLWDFWLWSKRRRGVPSEQAAKDALTARVAEWLREAGLEQVKEAGE